MQGVSFESRCRLEAAVADVDSEMMTTHLSASWPAINAVRSELSHSFADRLALPRGPFARKEVSGRRKKKIRGMSFAR
jgi:hypothetical protein